MNKKLDLLAGLIGTIAAMVTGILFALIYNWLMGRWMIGYSITSSIVAGGVFGALIGAPTTYLAMKETGKVFITTILIALASVAILALLKLTVIFVVAVSVSFAAAFGCVTTVMDRLVLRQTLSFFAWTGLLVGIGLYLANCVLGINAGFSWQGFFVIGLHGLICAVGAYFPVMMVDIHRSMKLDQLT